MIDRLIDWFKDRNRERRDDARKQENWEVKGRGRRKEKKEREEMMLGNRRTG